MTMNSVFFQNLLGTTGAKTSGFASTIPIPGKQGGESFFAMVRQVVQAGNQSTRQTGNVFMQTVASETATSSFYCGETGNASADAGKKGSSIEALRQHFLSRGTPLDQITLGQQDLEDLGTILEELQYPKAEINTFLQEMVAERQGSDITLADFFHDFSQFTSGLSAGTNGSATEENEVVDRSDIPAFESLLRGVGVSARAVSTLFATAVDGNGNLDMTRLLPQLKKIRQEMIHENGTDGDATHSTAGSGDTDSALSSVLTPRMASELKEMDLELSDGVAVGDAFTLEDLIGLMSTHVNGTQGASAVTENKTDSKTGGQNDLSANLTIGSASDGEKVETFFGHAREMMFRQKSDGHYFDSLNNDEENRTFLKQLTPERNNVLPDEKSGVENSSAATGTSGGKNGDAAPSAGTSFFSSVSSKSSGQTVSDAAMEVSEGRGTDTGNVKLQQGIDAGSQDVSLSLKSTDESGEAAAAASVRGKNVAVSTSAPARAAGTGEGAEEVALRKSTADPLVDVRSGDHSESSQGNSDTSRTVSPTDLRGTAMAKSSEGADAGSNTVAPAAASARGKNVAFSTSTLGQAAGIGEGAEEAALRKATADALTDVRSGNRSESSQGNSDTSRTMSPLNDSEYLSEGKFERTGRESVSDLTAPQKRDGQSDVASGSREASFRNTQEGTLKGMSVSMDGIVGTDTPTGEADTSIGAAQRLSVQARAAGITSHQTSSQGRGSSPSISGEASATTPTEETRTARASVDYNAQEPEPVKVETIGAKAGSMGQNNGRMDSAKDTLQVVTDVGTFNASEKQSILSSTSDAVPSAMKETPESTVTPVVSGKMSGMETAWIMDTWGTTGMPLSHRLHQKREVGGGGKGGESATTTDFRVSGNVEKGAAAPLTADLSSDGVVFSDKVQKLIDGIASESGRSRVQGTEGFSGESRHTESSDFFQQFQTASQTSETPVAQELQKTRAEGTLRFPEQTVQQVGKEIAQFVQRGDRVLKLQLKPAELGTVNIEMDVKENVMKLSVVAETSAAKEMLMASHSELRRVLEGYGVKLDTLDVDLSGSFDQSLADGNGSSFQGESNNSGTGTRFFNNFTNIPEEPLEASVPVERYRSSQLDLMA